MAFLYGSKKKQNKESLIPQNVNILECKATKLYSNPCFGFKTLSSLYHPEYQCELADRFFFLLFGKPLPSAGVMATQHFQWSSCSGRLLSWALISLWFQARRGRDVRLKAREKLGYSSCCIRDSSHLFSSLIASILWSQPEMRMQTCHNGGSVEGR